ncbi:MAG: sulfotransferase family 2 domain-containing protein [Halioglobus sp.]|nr:sulfotransferase family 2 domain-containing protein [Halioglobus sp.]
MFKRAEAYTHVPRLVENVNRMADSLRIVRGHVPYAVRSLLKGDFVAMTILRDPVERTLSYLKHCRKYHYEHIGLPMEQIYEQPWFFESFIHNYQTKIFSMTAQEALSEERVGDMSPPLPPLADVLSSEEPPPELKRLQHESPARVTLELFCASTGVIDADDARLETAKENLAQVELVGFTENYEGFCRKLHDRYGWKIDLIPRENIGAQAVLDRTFRARIEQDNTHDMELYEFALNMAN